MWKRRRTLCKVFSHHPAPCIPVNSASAASGTHQQGALSPREVIGLGIFAQEPFGGVCQKSDR